jgi:hypothetical protein
MLILNVVIIAKLLLKIKLQQVNKISINKFSSISIRGRFIYGYLCLINLIEYKKLISPPPELNELFQEFVYSDKLDEWHTKVEDILPSFILDIDEVKNEYFSIDIVYRIKEYYKQHPSFLVDMIEDLFWLGISNLYVAYSSENSLKYLKLLLEKMNKQYAPLPDFKKIEKCSITQRNGWGEYDDLKNY